MKEPWRTVINQAINKRPKSAKIDMLNESRCAIVTKQDIATIMNNNFCSVGKDLASKTEAIRNPVVTRKCILNPHNKHCNFKAIGVQEIREAMVKIKESNSFGSDKISSYCLKLAISLIERSLVFIFSTSLKTSHFLDS